MQSKILSSFLLLASMFAHPWAQAAGEAPASAPSAVIQAECVAGSVGCRHAADTDEHRKMSTRHDGREECASDSQDCDTRTKSLRDRAAADARDRHACRD